jgi:hypothetical protein
MAALVSKQGRNALPSMAEGSVVFTLEISDTAADIPIATETTTFAEPLAKKPPEKLDSPRHQRADANFPTLNFRKDEGSILGIALLTTGKESPNTWGTALAIDGSTNSAAPTSKALDFDVSTNEDALALVSVDRGIDQGPYRQVKTESPVAAMAGADNSPIDRQAKPYPPDTGEANKVTAPREMAFQQPKNLIENLRSPIDAEILNVGGQGIELSTSPLVASPRLEIAYSSAEEPNFIDGGERYFVSENPIMADTTKNLKDLHPKLPGRVSANEEYGRIGLPPAKEGPQDYPPIRPANIAVSEQVPVSEQKDAKPILTAGPRPNELPTATKVQPASLNFELRSGPNASSPLVLSTPQSKQPLITAQEMKSVLGQVAKLESPAPALVPLETLGHAQAAGATPSREMVASLPTQIAHATIEAPQTIVQAGFVAGMLQQSKADQGTNGEIETVNFAPEPRPTEQSKSVPVQLLRAQDAPRPVVQQIVDAIRLTAEGPVEVSLSPEELGRVKLSMVQVDGAMTVVLTAERSETLDLMRRHIDNLATELRNIGFENLNFSFESGGDHDAWSDAHQHGEQSVLDNLTEGSLQNGSTQILVAAADKIDIRI